MILKCRLEQVLCTCCGRVWARDQFSDNQAKVKIQVTDMGRKVLHRTCVACSTHDSAFSSVSGLVSYIGAIESVI